LLWASPCRYPSQEIIEGNLKLLMTLNHFKELGLLRLDESDTEMLKASTVPKDKTTGTKFYHFSVYLVLERSQMKIIAQYKGKQLQVDSDYKSIIPQESLFESDSDYKSRKINPGDGLKWGAVKKTIESL